MYDVGMTCDDVMIPGDEEMDQLRRRLAETERAMERIVLQLHRPLAGQVSQPPCTVMATAVTLPHVLKYSLKLWTKWIINKK